MIIIIINKITKNKQINEEKHFSVQPTPHRYCLKNILGIK